MQFYQLLYQPVRFRSTTLFVRDYKTKSLKYYSKSSHSNLLQSIHTCHQYKFIQFTYNLTIKFYYIKFHSRLIQKMFLNINISCVHIIFKHSISNRCIIETEQKIYRAVLEKELKTKYHFHHINYVQHVLLI